MIYTLIAAIIIIIAAFFAFWKWGKADEEVNNLENKNETLTLLNKHSEIIDSKPFVNNPVDILRRKNK